jgi:hypothetical protein
MEVAGQPYSLSALGLWLAPRQRARKTRSMTAQKDRQGRQPATQPGTGQEAQRPNHSNTAA